MSTTEATSSDPFSRKLLAVSGALYSVFSGKYPHSKQRAIYDYHPRLGAKEDALAEQESSLLECIQSDPDFKALSTLRKRTKGYLFAFYLAFTDQNSIALPEEILLKKQTRELVRRLFITSKLTGRTLDLTDQYQLAKKVLADIPASEHPVDLFDIVHLLHITFRRIARGFDEGVSGKVSMSTIRDSKKVPTPVSAHSNDPAGDVYHLWGAMGLTLLSNKRFKPYDILFNQVYRLAPKLAGWITKNVVYRLGANDGDIHTQIDQFGAKIGKHLARLSSVRQ